MKRKLRVFKTPSSGPPRYMMVKQKFTKMAFANILSNSSALTYYRLNSLYDPETALGGDQPYWFDQLSVWYKRYRVFAAKVVVKFSCSTDNVHCFHPTVLIAPYISGSALWSNLQDYMSVKGCVYRNVVPNSTSTVLKAYYPIHTLFGVAKRTLATDDQYAGTSGSNPTMSAELFYGVFNNNTALGGPVITATAEVQITYYSRFYDLILPAQS